MAAKGLVVIMAGHSVTAGLSEMNALKTTRYPVPHLAVLRVDGRDAAVFLQGQLTCDVLALDAGQSSLAALCNAKGRVISVVWLLKRTQDICLLVPASLLETVRTTLQRYVLRSQVQLRVDDSAVWAIESVDGMFNRQGMQSIRLPIANGYYVVVATDNATAVFADDQSLIGDALAWRRLELQAGLPWFDCAQSALYTPHMLNLDALGAISFTKGCYTGQEIVARTHYLGKVKRGLVLATSQAALPADCAGLSVVGADQQAVGAVLAGISIDNKGYAVVVVHDCEQALSQAVLADAAQTPLTLERLHP